MPEGYTLKEFAKKVPPQNCCSDNVLMLMFFGSAKLLLPLG